MERRADGGRVDPRRSGFTLVTMYLDSAIIVKLLVDEPESDFFSEALKGQPITSSELAITEVLSALHGKQRSKLLTATQRKVAWEQFNTRVQAGEIELQPLSGIVLKKAVHILERCHPAIPLRSLDAIHTAACDLSQDFPLCTIDQRMRAAARVLGIPVFPPDESPNP